MDRMDFIAQSIAKAKIVMEKVESGNYSRGNVNPSAIKLDIDPDQLVMEAPASARVSTPHIHQQLPKSTDVGQSKLHPSILESFRNKPAFGSTATGLSAVNTMNPLGMNMMQMDDLANATKKHQGVGNMTPQQRKKLEEQFDPTKSFSAPETVGLAHSYTPPHQIIPAPTLSEDYVKFLIEKTIEKTVEATVKTVMEQLNKTTAKIDEDFKITIGGKTFGGKLETLKG